MLSPTKYTTSSKVSTTVRQRANLLEAPFQKLTDLVHLQIVYKREECDVDTNFVCERPQAENYYTQHIKTGSNNFNSDSSNLDATCTNQSKIIINNSIEVITIAE